VATMLENFLQEKSRKERRMEIENVPSVDVGTQLEM
jgi:hypothetical protein